MDMTPYIKKLYTLLFFFPACVSATEGQIQKVQHDCSQPTPTELICDYRLVEPEPVTQLTAVLKGESAEQVGDISLPLVGEAEPYPFSDATTAVLFVVDTSNPKRQKVVEKNVRQIKTMLEKALSHHRFGLASLGTELRQLNLLGSDVPDLLAQLDSLQATDMNTELYRFTLEAIHILDEYEAKRKTLILFSDGKAEDAEDAYTLERVVKAAQEANVVLYGLGYPYLLNLNERPIIARLARMSEETGGPHFKADAESSDLPPSFLATPFRYIDNGARIHFDLRPAVDAGKYGGRTVILTWQLENQETLTSSVSVTLPPPLASTTEEEPITQPEDPLKKYLPYILGGGGTILLLALWFLLKGKRGEERIYAYLHSLDGNNHFPMNKTTVRIGRNADNEICLLNDSVSSHHAELHVDRHGEFTITDLDSTNGVVLNGETVDKAKLEAEDLLEIGEVRLRFVPAL